MRLIDADELKIQFDGHFVGVAKNDLDNAPTVEAEPIIHGHWIREYYQLGTAITNSVLVECSNCHKKVVDSTDFCPNCGAKMDEVKSKYD